MLFTCTHIWYTEISNLLHEHILICQFYSNYEFEDWKQVRPQQELLLADSAGWNCDKWSWIVYMSIFVLNSF
jgi:hypothetical protein